MSTCGLCHKKECDTVAFGSYICFECYEKIKNGELTCPHCRGYGFIPP